MVERTEFLEKLKAWKDEKVIKVVTGMRRTGKSVLLRQFRDLLKRDFGVGEGQIVYIDFDELENEEIAEYHRLYSYIKGRIVPQKMTYILIDEVQKVPEFERAVDSLFAKENTDIYITGSNSYLLSSDLATLLTGRYVELKMLPFSYSEFCSARDLKAGEESFALYMNSGGLPYLSSIKGPAAEKTTQYLEAVYNTVIVRDIEERQERKAKDKSLNLVNDILLLKTIARYLSSVVGSPVSGRNVANYLSSSGRKTSPNTVNDYLEALCESFIFYPVQQMDLNGKQILKAAQKFYIVDTGLRNYMLPKKNYDLGFTLENIVYFELLRRGCEVYTGRNGTQEIDFACSKNGVWEYIQVCANLTVKETFDREIRPLLALKDNYQKTILTLDSLTPGNYDGIQVVNAVRWLGGANV